ncbi:hypothetical protein ABQX22_08075 [Xanthomonas sp. WHRI 1810A]|uniref:hypothetical protein n=1 Tax=Xanthomonas sp. WHRI 1810A TaxID=3161565 RepID=UPI0032E87B4A
MKRVFIAVSLTSLFSLAGCAKDYSLAPPEDNEYVTVTIKVPSELVAETMNVMYRSPVCRRTSYGASGQRFELDGFHNVDIQPERQGQSDLYQAKLPVIGGGACRWGLSNLTFGVRYRDPTQYGGGVIFGGGGGVVVMLDQNNAPRGGANIAVEGDLILKKDYYPWFSESFLDGYNKFISLAGEGDTYLIYKAPQARSVYFEPVLHSNFMLRSVGPKVKKKGNYRSFTYPDGSVYADGRSHPNFSRLQAIRLKAESKQ